MATSIETKCSICFGETTTYRCHGCSKDFCFDHLTEHRQSLQKQLSLIQDDFNEFRQNIIDLKEKSQKPFSIRQINQWEQDSIQKIRQKADQCRQLVIDYTNQSIPQIEIQLNKTFQQFTASDKEKKDFNEIYLDNLRNILEDLNEKLCQPDNLPIDLIPNSFISEISVRLLTEEELFSSKQFATIVAGGHGRGKKLNQLNYAWGMCLDDDQTIYIADSWNHRIVEWKKNSNHPQLVAGGNGKGNENDQLDFPTGVIIDREKDSLIICDRGNRRVVRWPRRNGRAGEILMSNIDCWDLMMDHDGYLYISNPDKHEVRRWKIGDTIGTIVAGGNGQGIRLDQFSTPRNIFIDQDHSVYVSDRDNHRVMKWIKGAKEGIVVAGGEGQGNGLRRLSFPQGIVVDKSDILYVADFGNDRVMRWPKGAAEGMIIVGGNKRGQRPNQSNGPVYLSFDREKYLYVVDHWNDRVRRFDVN